jgi:hypothetical protein
MRVAYTRGAEAGHRRRFRMVCSATKSPFFSSSGQDVTLLERAVSGINYRVSEYFVIYGEYQQLPLKI